MESQAISSDLIRGHIDTIILHTLLDGDKFAQQISDAIEQKSDNEYKINQATLYSSLKRLENLKYASSYWNDTADNGGRRKYFKLTESGKVFVEKNLSNWSYSRAVIDKLMDCEPQPIYKTQYVEKIVEIPLSVKPDNSTTKDTLETPDKQDLSQKNDLINNTNADNVQEINFRNILGGLIKINTIKKPQQILEPIIEEKISNYDDNTAQKTDFNQAITQTDYSQKLNNGKIDFGDLMLKASKEGYKIRISSKDSGVERGSLLIRKLNLWSVLSIYLLIIIEFLILTSVSGGVLKPSNTFTLCFLGVVTILPILSIITYLKKPLKTTAKNIQIDTIFTASIVVFNLILITFAAALLLNINFTNTYNVLLYAITPAMVCIDIILFYTLRYILAKKKSFHQNLI